MEQYFETEWKGIPVYFMATFYKGQKETRMEPGYPDSWDIDGKSITLGDSGNLASDMLRMGWFDQLVDYLIDWMDDKPEPDKPERCDFED